MRLWVCVHGAWMCQCNIGNVGSVAPGPAQAARIHYDGSWWIVWGGASGARNSKRATADATTAAAADVTPRDP